MYKRFLFTSFLVFCFVGCSSQKYLIRKAEDVDFQQKSFKTISDSLSLLNLIQSGYFNKAEDLLRQNPDTDSSELTLANGMLSFYYGRNKEAEQSLLKVFREDTDSSRMDISYQTLYQLYFHQEQYNRLEDLDPRPTAIGCLDDRPRSPFCIRAL